MRPKGLALRPTPEPTLDHEDFRNHTSRPGMVVGMAARRRVTKTNLLPISSECTLRVRISISRIKAAIPFFSYGDTRQKKTDGKSYHQTPPG